MAQASPPQRCSGWGRRARAVRAGSRSCSCSKMPPPPPHPTSTKNLVPHRARGGPTLSRPSRRRRPARARSRSCINAAAMPHARHSRRALHTPRTPALDPVRDPAARAAVTSTFVALPAVTVSPFCFLPGFPGPDQTPLIKGKSIDDCDSFRRNSLIKTSVIERPEPIPGFPGRGTRLGAVWGNHSPFRKNNIDNRDSFTYQLFRNRPYSSRGPARTDPGIFPPVAPACGTTQIFFSSTTARAAA